MARSREMRRWSSWSGDGGATIAQTRGSPDLVKPGAHKNPDAIYDTRIYGALRKVIELALLRRLTVVAVTALMFVAAIASFGLVQQQFFPTSTRTELFFEMRLPEGSAAAPPLPIAIACGCF
jgi:multidrug efflux pump subunit AcrB